MVDNLYSLVEVVLGTSLLLWGVALLVHIQSAQALIDFIIDDVQSPIWTYTVAAVGLICGLAVVWAHNEWAFSPSGIVTLIGWIVTIECFLWIVFPWQARQAVKKLGSFLKSPVFLRGYGAVITVLGALIVWPYITGA